MSLDELVPGLLPVVPLDPYTGGALKYRLGEDGEPIVYSVGVDGDDDGGTWAVSDEGERNRLGARQPVGIGDVPDGDWGLWPVE